MNVNKELIKNLGNAVNEKDVEHAYWHCFSSYYPACIGSENKTDGLLVADGISSLMEFKCKVNLKNKLEAAAVIIQSLYYLKKMEKQGKVLPKSIFIGDNNECFCVSINPNIAKYLVTSEVDWSVAPSKAAAMYPDLVKKISEDNDINPFIYNIDSKFNFDEIIEKLKMLEKGDSYAITITNENVIEIFNYFSSHVIKDKKYTELNGNAFIKLADVFMSCLTDKDSTYLHPKKKNVLVCREESIHIDTNLYKSFFSHFKQEYTPQELEVVVANKDRIFDEIHRRRTGAFFTPPVWVAESQKMITEALGNNWRDEYIVWDCACGTANLTKDNRFKELYLSTLEIGDINTINDMGYNKGATIFQYDFLNEVGIDSVPESLKKAISDGKKLLIYINPPYGTAKNGGSTDGNSKEGIAKTRINEVMLSEGIGSSSQQLYAQFMYKIAKLQETNKNITIAIFSKPLFVSGDSFGGFRSFWNDKMGYINGMLFQASNFSDVSGDWGVMFSIWKATLTPNTSTKMDIVLTLKELNEDTFTIEKIGEKGVYSANEPASDWIREELKGLKAKDAPQMSSATCQATCKSLRGNIIDNALGYMNSGGNNVQQNSQMVGIYSSCYANGNGFSVIPENIKKVVALFTARKSIEGTWINDKDEYMVPDTTHPDYAQWNNDAIVYSLFNNSSQQSSLRDIDYKDKKWDIRNHFFFMSNKEMMDLANTHSFNEMYQDAKRFNEDTYIYNLLNSTSLSNDSKEVLEAAKELVKKSFGMRVAYHQEHPECHLYTWDGGWAQMKPMMKEHYKTDYDSFVKKYKAFEDRMREGVYTFGFLRK